MWHAHGGTSLGQETTPTRLQAPRMHSDPNTPPHPHTQNRTHAAASPSHPAPEYRWVPVLHPSSEFPATDPRLGLSGPCSDHIRSATSPIRTGEPAQEHPPNMSMSLNYYPRRLWQDFIQGTVMSPFPHLDEPNLPAGKLRVQRSGLLHLAVRCGNKGFIIKAWDPDCIRSRERVRDSQEEGGTGGQLLVEGSPSHDIPKRGMRGAFEHVDCPRRASRHRL